MRSRIEVSIMPVVARLLKRVGLRDTVLRLHERRRRARRDRAEARGDDRLSKPALFELDSKLDAIIDSDGGFFVEAGAHNGFTQSNTYWLERFRGWRGLLVEPMPTLATQARQIRKASTVVQCALIAADDPREQLHMRFGDLMSVVDGYKDAAWPAIGTSHGWRDSYEADVAARTLSSLLDEIEAPEVDLLSLDVEGFEEPALRGIDFERHAPRYVLVELFDREQNKPRIDAVLGDRYVEHGWLSPNDLLYVRRDVSELNGATGSAPAG